MGKQQISKEDFDLLGELGVDTTPEKKAARTPLEQRIIAGFEEIERFVEQNGRLPQHGEDRDIFERLYAVRLDRLRTLKECRETLKDIDTQGLLTSLAHGEEPDLNEEAATDEELLEALGVEQTNTDDLTQLKHVRSSQEKLAAEEIAHRTACKKFSLFKPLFDQVKRDIDSGKRRICRFESNPNIKKGDFFIIFGQMLYVSEVGEEFQKPNGKMDRRLWVVYENATESNLLKHSLETALYKDDKSRYITNPSLGPLFSNLEEEDDQSVGFIYVLRSKSEHPFIAENRKVIHKIGITKGEVKRRIANAAKDPTYLLAEVEIVETYKVSNLDLNRLEKLLHKFFDQARLDLQLKDRFGFDVEPREWFLLPLPIIEEAIQKLIEGNLAKCSYDPKEGRIINL